MHTKMSIHMRRLGGPEYGVVRLVVALLASLLSLSLFPGCATPASPATGQLMATTEAPGMTASPARSASAGTSAEFVASPVVATPETTAASNRCRSSDLELEAGPPVSEPTGQHTISLALINRSPSSCLLLGYPRLTLRDTSGEALPFEYRHQGDQVVTSAAPRQFELAPGASAYATLNKYRCDLGDQSLASSLQLQLPGDPTTLSLSLPSGLGVFGYCGAGDPGSIVSISPLEASFRATLSH